MELSLILYLKNSNLLQKLVSIVSFSVSAIIYFILLQYSLFFNRPELNFQ